MAKRTGQHLCIADHENYNMIDLNAGLLFPLLPLSQAPDAEPAKPSITVITDNEFLILSWNGATSMGLFITGDGDPVRGTLEWSAHPISVSEYDVSSSLRTHAIDGEHSLRFSARHVAHAGQHCRGS